MANDEPAGQPRFYPIGLHDDDEQIRHDERGHATAASPSIHVRSAGLAVRLPADLTPKTATPVWRSGSRPVYSFSRASTTRSTSALARSAQRRLPALSMT